MLICWLIGHRYYYAIRKPEWLALVCTRCGKACTLQETVSETTDGTRIRVTPTPTAPSRSKEE
jgi:hypothetical protein